MRIALAQINTCAADFETTARRMEDLSQRAADQDADLLVFPLAALTGPLPPDESDQEGYLLDLSDTLVAMSDAVSCACVVPVVTSVDGGPYAEAMLLHEGAVSPLRLTTLFSGGADAYGMGGHTSGLVPRPATFEWAGQHITLAFTYDDLNAAVDSDASTDVLLYIPVYGYALDDAGSALGASLAENRFRADARSLDAWFVAAGSLGGYGTQVYTGSSFVMSPDGEVVASAPAFEESLIVAEVGPGAQRDGIPFVDDEVYNRSFHLWEALTLGLHDLVQKQGLSDVALVLDDTLPSLLLTILASDALGPRHLHAVAGWDKSGEEGPAVRLARTLGVDAVDPHLAPVDDAEMRRDLLTVALSALVRATGALGISAEDKTYLALEAANGTCKASSLLPFGDVYRSDLVELAHMRNTISPLIAREAFSNYGVPSIEGLGEAEATPEMRLGRVDVTLSTYIEWGRSLTDVTARQGAPGVSMAIIRRLRQMAASRVAWPPYLMMSSRTLFDARTPIGFVWEDRVRTKDERIRGEKIADQITGTPTFSTEVSGGMDELASALSTMAEGADDGPAKELLGLLRDMLQNGDGQGQTGPYGPMTWGGPFSEN